MGLKYRSPIQFDSANVAETIHACVAAFRRALGFLGGVAGENAINKFYARVC